MSRASALTNKIRGPGEQIVVIAGTQAFRAGMFARGDVLANS